MAAVPVEVVIRLERHDGRGEAGGTVFWLFGLARIPLGEGGRRARAARKRTKVRRRRGKRHAARRFAAVLATEGFQTRLLGLAHDLLRRFHIRELSLRVRLGLDDPADTGRLWALVGPLAGTLALLPVARIAVEPQFASAAFDLDMRSRVRVIPLRLLFAVLAFALSPGTVRALRAVRTAA